PEEAPCNLRQTGIPRQFALQKCAIFSREPRRRPKHERFLQAASHQLTVAIGQAPGRQKKAGVGGAGEPPEPAAPAEKSHRWWLGSPSPPRQDGTIARARILEMVQAP